MKKNKKIEDDKELIIGICFCPICTAKMVPNHDGEWMSCPKGCVIDMAPEDCGHLYRTNKDK